MEKKFDLSCLIYVLYSLEFCCFIQGFWPVDAGTVRYFISLFIKNEDKEYFQLKQIPDIYSKRQKRSKDFNGSINDSQRKTSSKNTISTSDVSKSDISITNPEFTKVFSIGK